MLAHSRGCYPCKVPSQPSAALQEQLVRASRAGQALSCAKARPMLLAASQRAFWLRPPAISRRDMMNAGGSAVERLIFGTTAAGAAIGACVNPFSRIHSMKSLDVTSAADTSTVAGEVAGGEVLVWLRRAAQGEKVGE